MVWNLESTSNDVDKYFMQRRESCHHKCRNYQNMKTLKNQHTTKHKTTIRHLCIRKQQYHQVSRNVLTSLRKIFGLYNPSEIANSVSCANKPDAGPFKIQSRRKCKPKFWKKLAKLRLCTNEPAMSTYIIYKRRALLGYYHTFMQSMQLASPHALKYPLTQSTRQTKLHNF